MHKAAPASVQTAAPASVQTGVKAHRTCHPQVQQKDPAPCSGLSYWQAAGAAYLHFTLLTRQSPRLWCPLKLKH